MDYNNNTLIMSRPDGNNFQAANCQGSCSSSGSSCGAINRKIGPRKNREEVIRQIREYILHMLGGTKINVELSEEDIVFCANQALKIVEDYAPREFFTYYKFYTVPGQSVYKLPDDVGYVRAVHYREQSTFAFQANDLNGAIPIEYFYPGGTYASIQGGLIDPTQPIWGRTGEWVLYKQYEQMYSNVSSSIGGWEWIGGYRHIKLYPTPYKTQGVIVHYLQKCKDWEDVTQAMQEGALTYAKEILGRIRSKYSNVVSPGGGQQLDGQALLAEAKEERDKWKEDLIYRFGDVLGPSMG